MTTTTGATRETGAKRNMRTMAAEIADVPPGSSVRICGWVQSVAGDTLQLRDSTGEVAVDLSDAESMSSGGVASSPLRDDALEVQGIADQVGAVRARTLVVWPKRRSPTGGRSSADPEAYLRFRDPHNVAHLRRMAGAARVAREYLAQHHFVEVATPQVWNGTQEYGEPELSVVDPWSNSGGYLLQSPTVPQMLCSAGGLDRSYQFARCFRTEPGESPWKVYEFTQLNLASAFTSVAEQRVLLEGLLEAIAEYLGIGSWKSPFPAVSYHDALHWYGCDYPDARFASIPQPIVPGDVVGQPGRQVRLVLLPGDGHQQAIRSAARPVTDHLGDDLGVWWWASTSPIAGAWHPPSDLRKQAARWQVEPPFGVIAVPADVPEGTVRRLVAGLYPAVTDRQPQPFAAVWVDHMPFFRSDPPPVSALHNSRSLFGRRIDDGRATSQEARVEAYDLVLNGVEVLSGSQKEWDPERLLENFSLAGVPDPSSRYGYLLDALEQGTPPLHNTSIGWERLLALLLGVPMRNLIVMPKGGGGACEVSGLPVPHPHLAAEGTGP